MSKDKIDGLLQRFPVTDLALALSKHGEKRQMFLRRFVETFVPQSYRALRDHANSIYSVEPNQQTFLPPYTWSEIEAKIRKSAGQFNADRNIRAARLLKSLVEPRDFKGFELPEQSLHIGPGRIVSIGIRFYLVENDCPIIHYVQPRADSSISDDVARFLMSMVHYAYVHGDYEDAKVEMADLSAVERAGEREPRFRRLNDLGLHTREQLNKEIDAVYSQLEWIAKRGK